MVNTFLFFSLLTKPFTLLDNTHSHVVLDRLIYFSPCGINVTFTVIYRFSSRVFKWLTNTFGIISAFLWHHCKDAYCLLHIVNLLISTQRLGQRLNGKITLGLFLIQYPSSSVYSLTIKTSKFNDWKCHAGRSLIFFLLISALLCFPTININSYY